MYIDLVKLFFNSHLAIVRALTFLTLPLVTAVRTVIYSVANIRVRHAPVASTAREILTAPTCNIAGQRYLP